MTDSFGFLFLDEIKLKVKPDFQQNIAITSAAAITPAADSISTEKNLNCDFYDKSKLVRQIVILDSIFCLEGFKSANINI